MFNPFRKPRPSSAYVSASDLGQFTFCQESARHAFVGKHQSRMARSRMRRGTLTHRKWQRRKDRPTFKSLAFLASLIGLVLAIGAVVVALV